MSSKAFNLFARPFLFRLVFAFILLCLSSVALGVHFLLGNSFSVIHSWFEYNFSEIIGYSSLVLYTLLRYLGAIPNYRSLANKDALYSFLPIGISIAMMIFLFSAYGEFHITLSSLKSTSFLALFFIFDFYINKPSDEYYKIRHQVICGLSSTLSMGLILFLFFGYGKNLSYSFMYLQFLAYIINYTLKLSQKTFFLYVFILYLMFFVGIGGSLFFPENNSSVSFYCLIFFLFNLLILFWHYFFNKKLNRSII